MSNVENLPAKSQTPQALVVRGFTNDDARIFEEALWPGASAQGILLALDYCKARKLDPFKRPVHIVKTWNSAVGKEVETVWPGVSELRTTAARTGEYVGCDAAAIGEDTTMEFQGSKWVDRKQVDATCRVTFPEWCQITVYRLISGNRVPFVGPKVYWLETYASIGKNENGYKLPNSMWQKRPRGQLEKCAEAAALRKAFPEEIGGDLTYEEMAGQTIGHTDNMVQPVAAEDAPPRPEIKAQSDAEEAPDEGYEFYSATGEVEATLPRDAWLSRFNGNLSWGQPPNEEIAQFIRNNIDTARMINPDTHAFYKDMADAGWSPDHWQEKQPPQEDDLPEHLQDEVPH